MVHLHELSIANKAPIVAPGVHLEAIVADCMLAALLVFPTRAPPRHALYSCSPLLQSSSKEEEQVEHKEQDSPVHSSHTEMVSSL